MKRTSPAILATLVCMSASVAFGQASAPQTSASPPSAGLDGFAGDGICIGHQLREGKTPGPAKPARAHGEKALDGHWVVVRYEEEPTAANPKPYKVAQYFGYDPTKKHFVTVALANSDGNYYVGTSLGWEGNTITFDELDPGEGKLTSFRDVFTIGDSGMSSHVGMMKDKHGNWVKTDEETCHKA